MTYLYYSIVLLWTFLVSFWFVKRRGAITSLYDIFLITSSYYALCVPLDSLLGLEILGYQETIDLNKNWALEVIQEIFYAYLFCILTFLATYKLAAHAFFPAGSKNTEQSEFRSYPLPFLLVISVSLFALSLYTLDFWGLTRGERFLAISTNWNFKLTYLLLLTSFLLNVIYMWSAESRAKCVISLCFGILMSLITGGRTWAVMLVLLYFTRYRPRIPIPVLLVGIFAGFLTLTNWKLFTEHVRSLYLGGGTSAQISVSDYSSDLSLSVLEGGSVYSSMGFILYDQESPLWLGETYTLLPLRTIILKYFSHDAPETLSLKYIRDVAPELIERGNSLAFPALAEAWLNFGSWGYPLVGLVLALIAFFLDHRPKGIVFIIAFFFFIRFYRSDFASVFKLYIVMLGGITFLLVAISWLYRNILSPGRKRGLHRPVRNNP